jgi:hypothetical protein
VALTLSMHMPEALRLCQERLAIALTTPLLATWDPDRTYEHASQPGAIARC